ncbi:MAG: hypothetical protein M3Y58_09855 [Chloroflexota bacterium]|nr:hypothetical protein [Chloroflexota bacterium]
MTDTANDIGVQQAVQIAREQMRQVFGNVEDLQLEEVEQSPDESKWLVTLSFLRVDPTSDSFMQTVASLRSPKTRVYKIVTVDAKSGNARSVKIRKL